MAFKWDTVLYDRDGYMAGIGRRIWKLDGERLAIRISTRKEQGTLVSDFGSDEVAEEFILSSDDGGLGWDTYEGTLPGEVETKLPDGTLISVVGGCERSVEENRAVLASVGRNPNAAGGHMDFWPESMADELIEKGYVVFPSFTGTVMSETALDCLRSFDGGETYERKRIEGLPKMGRRIGTFRTLLCLDDGTLVTACFGRWKGGTVPTGHFSYALRSEDKGESWKLIPIGDDPNRDFDETDLLLLPDGRILAMLRSYEFPSGSEEGSWAEGNISWSSGPQRPYLHQSFSNDGGLTWSKPEPTPMWGYPPQLTLLESGAIHCTYAHRRYPYGIRACLSHDNGKSWDIENEIIVRDDSITGIVDYPTSVQLSDGTIVTAYSFERIPRVPYSNDDVVSWEDGKIYGDVIIHGMRVDPETQGGVGGCHRFVGLSRYTPDYVRPRGQTTSKVQYTGVTIDRVHFTGR